MTLDDCDLPEVRSLPGIDCALRITARTSPGWENAATRLVVELYAALAAVYEKWQEAKAECVEMEAESERTEEEAYALAKEHGLPLALDHLDLAGLANMAGDLHAEILALKAERDEWKHKWEADQRMDR